MLLRECKLPGRNANKPRSHFVDAEYFDIGEQGR